MIDRDAREILVDLYERVNNNSDCTFPLKSGWRTLDTYDDFNIFINIAFRGVGITIMTVFGISMNVLSVIVLTHPNLKSSLTTLLLGLTISDILVIGTHFLNQSLDLVLNRIGIFPSYFTLIGPYINPWILPVLYTAQMSSIYFTVIITLERYIAVCHPFKARSLCSRSSANRAFLLVILISVLYNIPRWFEYEAFPVMNCNNQVLWYDYQWTEFGGGDHYVLYYFFWGYTIVFFIIPFLVLGYFNFAIYNVVKQQRSMRTSLNSTRKHETNEDIQLAVMLLGIVITFLLCYILTFVCTVIKSFGLYVPNYLSSFKNFLAVFSHSTNFIFYCAFGARFRRQLRKTLEKIKERRVSVIDSTITICERSGSVQIFPTHVTYATSSSERKSSGDQGIRKSSKGSSCGTGDSMVDGSRNESYISES